VFLSHIDITTLVLVIHPDDYIFCKQILSDIIGKLTIINGGCTRQESVYAGLQYLQDIAPSYVHIHDGVRPFINHQQLTTIHRALTPSGGVLLAIPVSDTLKRVGNDKCVVFTVPHDSLFAAQTPQSFPYPLILSAHKAAYEAGQSDFTDDSALAEWYNIPMRVVESSSSNIKITWEKDIEMTDQYFRTAETPCPDVRTGNGYDVHRLVQGHGVVLCGMKIPCDKKLIGHSDADVALHALTDALLATQGAGDIGMHFPPANPQWKNVQSEIFVRHAVRLIRERNGRIANVDITLIAEMPAISPYRAAMTKSLQNMLAQGRNCRHCYGNGSLQ